MPELTNNERMEIIELEHPVEAGILDDDRDELEFIEQELKDLGVFDYYVRAESPEFLKRMNEYTKVVAIDYRLSGETAMEVLIKIREINPDVKVVLMSGHLAERAQDGLTTNHVLKNFINSDGGIVGFVEKVGTTYFKEIAFLIKRELNKARTIAIEDLIRRRRIERLEKIAESLADKYNLTT